MSSNPVCRRLQRAFLFGAGLALAAVWGQGAGAIEQPLSRLGGFQVQPAAAGRPSDSTPGSRPGPISPALLDEYVLTSYSRWEVTGSGAGSPAVLDLEVYEMLDSLGAFGLYSIWPDLESGTPGKRMNLSVDNRYGEGKLAFWSGNFFFQVSSRRPDPEPESLLALARALLDELDLLNLPPLTVIQLPREELNFDSIRYFLGAESFQLSRQFPAFLVPHLGLDRDIEITEARYGRESHRLFLVGYPTPALAHAYYLELQDALQSYFSPQGIYLTRAGVVVGIFFGPEPEARAVLGKVQYTPTIKWLHGGEDAIPEVLRSGTAGSVLLMVKRSLMFILVFLGVSLTGGLAAGMVRYGTIRRLSAKLSAESLVFINLDRG